MWIDAGLVRHVEVPFQLGPTRQLQLLSSKHLHVGTWAATSHRRGDPSLLRAARPQFVVNRNHLTGTVVVAQALPSELCCRPGIISWSKCSRWEVEQRAGYARIAGVLHAGEIAIIDTRGVLFRSIGWQGGAVTPSRRNAESSSIYATLPAERLESAIRHRERLPVLLRSSQYS